MASLAVLADTNRRWRPNRFSYRLWGCEPGIRFPVVKLLDYERNWAFLEESSNPFAVVVMAHLKTLATRRKPGERSRWKLELIKGLYRRGWDREDVLELFRFIDWLMVLPEELERQFDQNLKECEDKAMPYVTGIERRAIQQGICQGIRQSLVDTLETRFGEVPPSLVDALQQITDSQRLQQLHRQALRIMSLGEFEEIVRA